MFFTKFPHPANFSWAKYDGQRAEAHGGSFRIEIRSYEQGLSQIVSPDEARWGSDPNLLSLNPGEAGEGCVRWEDDRFVIVGPDGETWLESEPGHALGVSEEAHMFQFRVPADARYYGMGEKWLDRIELSGLRTKYWNTDVWSDFHWAQWGSHPVDPPYFTTPYLIVRTERGYVGFLIHNPGVTYMETPGHDRTRVFVAWQETYPNLLLGAECGPPNLWVLVDTDLNALTAKLQKLVGVTPRPPMWALGYHQSRWGYGGERDLEKLSRRFAKEGIPCSGLWLDLDYMEGYRIFTVDDKQFPNGVAPVAAKLLESGQRIVPILDPGVKKEAGYSIFDHGTKADIWCQNPIGEPYVGLVWPGETVFPDFTIQAGREWWTKHARAFFERGFAAAWVDMNDPSTGPVDPAGMRFRQGTEAHARHRNQYALGMQMATVEAFRQAKPGVRPFLLSRSGFVGSSRYGAIWTGDNLSNWYYLRQSIPTSLGLSLSGMPFTGPDIGGFGGDSTPELMTRWMQANFLFPFFRNHSNESAPDEEPWRFGRANEVIAHFIRLRYQFLPYLYQCFVRQERRGEPILRPVMAEFNEEKYLETSDAFFVGASLLQAPVLTEGARKRAIDLPEAAWWNLADGEWYGGGVVKLACPRSHTPVFVRGGHVVPVQAEAPRTPVVDLAAPCFLVANPAGDWSHEGVYEADDAETEAYQSGATTRVEYSFHGTGKHVEVTMRESESGWESVTPTLWFARRVKVKVNGVEFKLHEHRVKLTGSEFIVFSTGPINLPR